MAPCALICHDRGHIEAALAAAATHDRPVLLLTPEGAAGYGGPGYFQALFANALARQPVAHARCALDCGDDAAMALFALEAGWRALILRGSAKVRARVAAAAGTLGAELLAPPRQAVDLGLAADPAAAIEQALAPG